MHPLAIMGLLAVVGGLVAAAVALARLHALGMDLRPVLVQTGVPLLLFVAGLAYTVRLARRGRRAGPWLVAVTFVAYLAYWILNAG